MVKQRKNNPSVSPPVPREAIAAVRGEEDFVELLRRELEWPIPMNVQRLADVAIPHDLQRDFGFKPEEDRIAVSRLLNLTEEQPWGVFLFEFKTMRPYLSHLHRLLRGLGSQRTLRHGDPIWDRNDLLFICTHDWKDFQLVHFAGEKPESAVISSFGWKGPGDPFLHTLCKHNLPRLRMPQPKSDGDYDADGWRSAWRDAFSVKSVTDEFFATLKEVFEAVQAGVKGLEGEDRRFFAELVVNRMVFLKFVEKKGWLDGDQNYLYNRFQEHGRNNYCNNYWRHFLCDFFFEGLCKEKDQRTKTVNELLGNVPFLNAELFAPSDKWDDCAVEIENRVFTLLFDKLLNPYNFTVCETSPLDVEVAFNQDLLGYGYEELIADQHGQGAYYTHPTEVNLMCRESLRAFLEGRCPEVGKELIGKLVYAELTDVDPVSEKDALALYRVLHDVTVVDPALGSGTFPVAMMKHLFLALHTLGGYLNGSAEFANMLKQDGITDPNDAFALKLHIIERSIYGCDIDYFAVQIAKLRFWIELMVNCDKPEALPNFNCKLVVGDALASAIGTDSKGNLITLEDLLGHPTKDQMTFGQLSVEKLAELKSEYFNVRDTQKRKLLENQISQTRDELLRSVGVQTDKIKRTDKHVLWQIDFAEIFTGKTPGFDIVIANPPYLRQELIDRTFEEFTLSIRKELLLSLYKRLSGQRINGKSDIYIFFFFRAHMLTKPDGGMVCFICSNSWIDVEYGWSLQRYISKHVTIRALIESQVKRSFENADINTAICLFQNCILKEKPFARFISLNSGYHEPASASFYNMLMFGNKRIETPNYHVRIVDPKTLTEHVHNKAGESGGKWGGFYLRAPSIFGIIVNSCRSALVPLRTIADVEFGLKTGNNSFFLLSEQVVEHWGIENKFIRYIVKSPQHVRFYTIDDQAISTMILYCPQSDNELKGSRVWDYIMWGQKQGVQNAPSVRSHSPWWFIGHETTPDAVWFKAFHNRFIYPINTIGALVSDRFYKITTKINYEPTVLAASLNNAFTILCTELMGRTSLGEGALDNMTYEAASNLVFLPELMPPRITLPQRPVFPIDEELKQNDRRAFDEAVFKAVGLSHSHLDAIYEAIINLSNNRLTRARSFKDGQ